MSDYDFDLFVIGAGSGGVRAARIAALNGAKVAIAEQDRIGGTCVIRGCVPKKIMVLASRFHDAFRDAEGYGWTVPQKPVFSWERLKQIRDAEVERLSGIYETNLLKAGVVVFKERAAIAGKNRITLGASQTAFSAKNILVAVGDKPVKLDIEGKEHGITSDDFFNLEQQPQTMLLIGSGYIAVEFSCLLQRLGTRVSVAFRGEHLLSSFDADIQAELMGAMAQDGIALMPRTQVQKIELLAETKGRRVTFHDGSQQDFDAVMFATGRDADTDRLGVENGGLTLGARGILSVDETSNTGVSSIHAVGDVTGGLKLTPLAIKQGHAFSDSAFSEKTWTVDSHVVATAIFTTPEIGTVGLSEKDALEQGFTVDIYKTRFRSLKHVLTERQERTLMKVIVDSATDRVLGIHIVGEEAGELIQLAGTVLQNNLTKAQLDATIPVHPTVAEELVTLKTCKRAAPLPASPRETVKTA